METLSYAKATKANKDHKCDFCLELIAKGTEYELSVHKGDGGVYSWKTHKHCAELASKLRWYDNCDEGLTTEGFIESLKCEYQDIMHDHYNAEYESKDFKYPQFKEQLSFVLKHHKIPEMYLESLKNKDNASK